VHDGRLQAVLDRIASNAARHDRDASFPFEAIAALEQLGVARLSAPVAAGGYGAGLVQAREIAQRIGAADASVGLVMLWQFVFHAEMAQPDHGWSASARAAVLESIAQGPSLINALNVEPELGSPSRGGLPATRAVRQPDGSWRVHGRKTYATGIPVLRWLLITATIEDDGEPRVGRFVVDTRLGGLRVEETWDHVGLRATASHDVVFEDTPLPAGHLIAQDQPGRKMPMSGARNAWTATCLGAMYNGIAHASRNWLVGYLHQRVPSNLGAPLASLPRFQSAVGEIDFWLATSDRLLDDVARAVDGDDDAARRRAFEFAPLLKHHVTSNAIAVASRALELTGNPGHSRHHPAERHLRDALTGRIHTPQSDVIFLNTGKAALERAAAGSPK
jgi:alkylation response protein AidB-like acyl-CoA dehydrogenase